MHSILDNEKIPGVQTFIFMEGGVYSVSDQRIAGIIVNSEMVKIVVFDNKIRENDNKKALTDIHPGFI